jgi:hypothetical protein
MNVNKLAQAVQNCQVGIRKLGGALKQFGDPQLLLKRLDALEGKQLSFREYTMLNAEKTIPFSYRIDVTITAASTARVPGSTTINEEGYFFLDRIYFSWLPDTADGAAAPANVWTPFASSNPFLFGSAAVAGAAIGNDLNFFTELSEGRAQRDRQDQPVPGDIFLRQDGDGILGPEGDAFGPNSSVTAHITPTLAPTNGGTLYVTLQGVQCLDYLKG